MGLFCRLGVGPGNPTCENVLQGAVVVKRRKIGQLISPRCRTWPVDLESDSSSVDGGMAVMHDLMFAEVARLSQVSVCPVQYGTATARRRLPLRHVQIGIGSVE